MLKNNGNNKHRMTYIDSIMKDPNISKLIFEASSAPLGSTKRKQAKSTINIIKRSDKNNYLGKGGPGFDGQGGIFDGIKNFLSGNKKKAEASTAPTTRPAPVQGPMQGPSLPENKIIFPAAPEIKNNFLKTSGTKPQTKINQITSGFMNTISPIIGGKDKKDLYADYKLSPQNSSDYGYKLGELGKQPSLSNLDGVTLNKNIKDIEKEASVGSIKDQRKIKRGSIREQRDDKRETIREINQEIARLNNQLSFSAGNAINAYGGLSGNNQSEEIYRKIQFLNEKKKEVKSGFKESRDDIKDTFKENKRNIKSGNYLSLGSNKEAGTTAPEVITDGTKTEKEEPTTVESGKTGTQQHTEARDWSNVDTGEITASKIASAIAMIETGGGKTIRPGASGELASKYQYMPGTWERYSLQYNKAVNGVNKPLPFSNDIEDDVTEWKIQQWLDDGYRPEQIAAMWNAGEGRADTWQGHYGVNSAGVKYNTPRYVNDFMGIITGERTDYEEGGSYPGASGSGYDQTGTSGGGSLDMEQAAAMAKQFSDAGYGKEAFAEYMMSLGGSVSDKTKRLAQTLYDEYDLEQKANRLSEMNEMSPNIERDIIDYIRSRDEYVNSINYQLDTLAETYASTDTSNPYTEQMFQNYKNYLITIKGRQNKRYTQYVTDSVNSFKTDLERIKNDYDSAKKSYDDALKSGTKMLEDEAQQRIKVFEGLYNAQEDLPERTLRLSKLQSEVNKVNLETIYGYTAYGQGKGFLTGEAKDLIIDSKTGNVKQGASLTSILDQLTIEGDVHPADVINTFSGGAINELNFLSKSNPSEAIIKGQQYINDMMDAVGSKSRLPEATKQELYTRLIEPLKQKMITAMTGTADPTKENPEGLLGFFKKNYTTVKSASKDLSEGDKSWFLGSKKPVSKDDFIKKYKSKLGQELADALYESDKLYKDEFDGETILDELQARIEANKEVPMSGSGVFFAELPEETQLAYILSLRVGSAINYFNE